MYAIRSYYELSLWTRKRHFFLEGKELADAKSVLPRQFQKDDIVQIFVCPRFGAGRLQSMLLYSKRRQPFNDLDIKFLTLASQMFHDKVYLLWEQKKLRDLEMVYLQQEIALRQTDKLATLGKLSAGMAHELNNPAAAAQRSAARITSYNVCYTKLLRSGRCEFLRVFVFYLRALFSTLVD